jgi:hypothetical protein
MGCFNRQNLSSHAAEKTDETDNVDPPASALSVSSENKINASGRIE